MGFVLTLQTSSNDLATGVYSTPSIALLYANTYRKTCSRLVRLTWPPVGLRGPLRGCATRSSGLSRALMHTYPKFVSAAVPCQDACQIKSYQAISIRVVRSRFPFVRVHRAGRSGLECTRAIFSPFVLPLGSNSCREALCPPSFLCSSRGCSSTCVAAAVADSSVIVAGSNVCEAASLCAAIIFTTLCRRCFVLIV